MARHTLVIDQGTTSTRSIVFDGAVSPVATAQQEFPQIYPRPGWVEHDPEAIWDSVVATDREALAQAGLAARDIAALGIANQRETVVIWDRRTGRAIHNAIVWQDRRTAGACERLEQLGYGGLIAARTGLLIDPYFSATKIAWLLETVDGARAAAEAGHLAFGTIDSYLLWRLTEGAVHATDATNASRTLLFDIRRGAWDEELLALFGIPAALLPEVRDTAGMFGDTAAGLFGGPIGIRGIAGDQQAALVGQACFRPGMVKSTYGTGCFALLNTGRQAIASRHRLVTTIAYQLDGARTYALEGSIFVAGAAVQWLRDGLGLIASAAEAGALAAESDPGQPVYMVPAFVGLGAPHWDSAARALLTGLTRGTTRKELARAALECAAYQTRDLLDAMQADTGSGWAGAPTVVRVDGGMSASDWTMQFLADILAAPVDRPACLETTALGAAYLAGMAAGVYPDPETFAAAWTAERRFAPSMRAAERAEKYRGWQDAVARTLLRPGGAGG
ncbi:glycerol kinase GlpK [Rhodopila globiformis]|uniref:Glycerol kinase n=1 Tax=Rhodopila globiformis TaxID=1071 RepID=A0A2S6NNL8_RHOGL|nr:glycerol kinase GlpK [Rhodopila globiformis]PPQ39036.1 glycerol kinase [Rhodopila globiformis]